MTGPTPEGRGDEAPLIVGTGTYGRSMINGQSDGERLMAALNPVIAVLRDIGMTCSLITQVPDGTVSIIDLTGPFSLPSEPLTAMGRGLADEITEYLKNEN